MNRNFDNIHAFVALWAEIWTGHETTQTIKYPTAAPAEFERKQRCSFRQMIPAGRVD